MRRYVLPVVAATALLPAVPATAAPSPYGAGCALTVVEDPLVAGTATAVVTAALVLADDTDPSVLRAGRVVCRVDVDSVEHRVAGPVTAAVAVAAGTVPLATEAAVAVCTQVDLAGGPTLFRDHGTGGWSTVDAGCWSQVRTP